MEKLLEAKELYTNFYTFEGVVKALNGVSIEVKKGETYGLVGESGCGKSVTVRSLMRIVQSPGKIEDGEVRLFFNEENKTKAIDILDRSEAYMQSIRGNDISMIFQEASSSLNPVFTIGFQVGESIRFHRISEIMDTAIENLKEEQKKTNTFMKGWKGFQIKMLNRELQALARYEKNILEIDNELYRLEGAEGVESKKNSLKKRRDFLRKTDRLASFVKHVPFLKRYPKALEKVIRKEVVSLLTELGVPNPENIYDRYPHELSGGMQQRIVIAIALACHPTLLIADEPTSNLDVTIQAQILDLLRKLKETKISSILFITHDLGVVADICDRVTVMYAGDTCETSAVKELFEKPLHPYTKGLLNSVPKEHQEGALETIPGNVPNLVHPPEGCRFHPRCPHAMDICKKQKPVQIEYSPEHTVSCHLYTKEGEK